MPSPPKRTIRTYERGERLIEKLARGYSVAAACRAEKIGRQRYYEWLASDADFAARCDEAIEAGTDVIEDVARKKAIAGDNTMIVLMLKARRPEKYRERADVQVSGSGGGPISVLIGERADGPQ